MVQRTDIFRFARKAFGVEPDYPFAKYPHYAVLRHADSGKWFGLVMDVDRQRLGLDGEGSIDVIDLKCDPRKVEALRATGEFLSAYHMNKEHWLTVPLSGAVPMAEIERLLRQSFELTR